MYILHIAWEYPPRIIGGIARHVEELSGELAKLPSVEVHVVTCEHPNAEADEICNGVHIHRVSPKCAANGETDFIQWVHSLNTAMFDRASVLCKEWLASDAKSVTILDHKLLMEPDAILLHAHDWLAYFSAVKLKFAFKLPLVATIHATEFGRNGGIHSEISHYINAIEKQLVTDAWRVIVCSQFMKGEVQHALSAPEDKLDVIYNGIKSEKFNFAFPPEEAAQFRSRFAAPDERIVMFVGRGVREKGCQVLIEAFPTVRAELCNTKLVIAGGGNRQHLIDQAESLGIRNHVDFTGFISDADLMRLYKVADVACFPSLYEPFGIVALEAMAAQTPVVVSDSGGLQEVVDLDVTGTTTYSGDSNSLAWGILRILNNPTLATRMANCAYERCTSVFNWSRISVQTHAVYRTVWEQYQKSDW